MKLTIVSVCGFVVLGALGLWMWGSHRSFVAPAADVATTTPYTQTTPPASTSPSTLPATDSHPQPSQSAGPASVPAQSSPVPTAQTKDTHPLPLTPSAYKSVMTTLFWAGEDADESNAYIANSQSYWDDHWAQHYGGIDSPDCRTGYNPCKFTPKENPFYFALPYGEYDDNGDLKQSAKDVPWYVQGSAAPLLKNHWIEVKHGDTTCYGQWEDVGPFEEDDWEYVFGSAKPLNKYNAGAGLDVSPALWDCLGMTDNDVTSWRFIDVASVPAGPWKDTVTSSGTSW